MHFKQDLHIHGQVSKRLYKNVMNYLQRILSDFSDDLSPVNVIVDGFKEADGNPDIIGASLSCGVDALSTIYDRYVNEDDPDYKINALFFFNAGWHGDCRVSGTRELFLERYNQIRPAAKDLGLPIYVVDSNLSAFVFSVYGLFHAVGRVGHFANFSCILGLQRGIRKYYYSSSRSYRQMMKFSYNSRGDDFAGFSESYSVPLIRTEKVEIIPDGCQYERSRKTENISGWEIARKYLNVCSLKSYHSSATAHNCSMCDKCMRTLTALEALGKLDDFSGVFDIETYRRHSFRYRCEIVLTRNRNAQNNDVFNFAMKNGIKMPSYIVAWLYSAFCSLCLKGKNAIHKILGDRIYDTVKRALKRKG